jgi:hypothetical protein
MLYCEVQIVVMVCIVQLAEEQTELQLCFTDSNIARQTDRQTDRQADRQTDKTVLKFLQLAFSSLSDCCQDGLRSMELGVKNTSIGRGSRGSSVSMDTRLRRAGRPRVQFPAGAMMGFVFLITTASRLTLRRTQPPMKLVKRVLSPGGKANRTED